MNIRGLPCRGTKILRSGGLVIGLCLLLGGCGEDPQQLWETAQFEEQQHNLSHAQELYERIMREHPASEQAERAKERMTELQKASHPEQKRGGVQE